VKRNWNKQTLLSLTGTEAPAVSPRFFLLVPAAVSATATSIPRSLLYTSRYAWLFIFVYLLFLNARAIYQRQLVTDGLNL
jgi:hypothetical protein